MGMDDTNNCFEKIITSISKLVNNVGVAFLVIMMVLIVFDVLLRTFFNWAILSPYVYEAIELMMVVLVFFGLSYCELQQSNIKIDLLVSKFGKTTQAIFDAATYLISIAFVVVIVWRSMAQAIFVKESKTIAMALNIPIYPFFFVIGVGCLLLCFALVLNFSKIWGRILK